MSQNEITIHTVYESLDIELDGETWRGEWVSYVMNDGMETFDRFLRLSFELGDNFYVPQVSESEEAREVIRERLAEQRVKNIRDELGLQGVPSPSEIHSVILQISEQAWEGSWMGQTHNSVFYAEHLALILGLGEWEVLGLIRSSAFVGLNGFIIIPKEQEVAHLAFLEETTGHAQLYLNDSGGWRCLHCGNSHDPEDEIRPNEVPCMDASDLMNITDDPEGNNDQFS